MIYDLLKNVSAGQINLKIDYPSKKITWDLTIPLNKNNLKNIEMNGKIDQLIPNISNQEIIVEIDKNILANNQKLNPEEANKKAQEDFEKKLQEDKNEVDSVVNKISKLISLVWKESKNPLKNQIENNERLELLAMKTKFLVEINQEEFKPWNLDAPL